VLGAGCFDSTGLRLFQYPDDLLLAKSPLHFLLLLLPEQNYTFQLSSFWGAGHVPIDWTVCIIQTPLQLPVFERVVLCFFEYPPFRSALKVPIVNLSTAIVRMKKVSPGNDH
jgi:hypothetical protein